VITLFTGAGASKALGYPITTEFFSVGMGKTLQRNNVYQQVHGFLKKNVVDVEDALRLLYPYVDLMSTPTGQLLSPHVASTWIGEIPDFVKTTNELCFDHYGRIPAEEDVKKYYLPVLEYCSWADQKVSLFTTNYDPVTDVLIELAEAREIPSHDGFNRFGSWDSGGYARVRAKGLAVHRLHGSMSWIEKDGRIRNTRDYSKRAPGYAEHLIIYPGFKGNPESDGHAAFRFAHTALRKELAESSAVVAIGFSFRDPHLNDILRDTLRTNDKLKLVVWNPIWPEGSDVGLGELKQDYPERVKHLQSDFGSPDLDVKQSLDGLFLE
jgi:hypothetical protein